MLGNPPFTFNTIEKITGAFGYIFEDISIQRIDPNTSIVKTIKVPISQAAKDKWAVREAEDPNAGDEARQRHVQIILPRMAYRLTNMRYDPHRKLPTINYRVAPTGTGPSARVQLNPIPYLFDFTLWLQTKTLTDAFYVVEQILSYFRPDYVVPIVDIPQMNLKRDIVVILNDHSYTDSFDGEFTDKREIMWTFNFTAQGHIYPPIKTKPVIVQSDILVHDFSEFTIDVRTDPNDANLNEPYDIVVSES